MAKKANTYKRTIDPVDGVNGNERDFCVYYITNGGQQRDAARKAFSCKSDNVADRKGNYVMKRPRVIAFLNKMREKMGIDVDGLSQQAKQVIDELALLSFSDPANYVDALQLPAEVCEAIKAMGPERRAISEIEITKRSLGSEDSPVFQTDAKFKFHSKVTALSLLGKHHKLYVDLIKHQVEKNSPEIYMLPDNGMKEKA